MALKPEDIERELLRDSEPELPTDEMVMNWREADDYRYDLDEVAE